jgi:hypothetical protein
MKTKHYSSYDLFRGRFRFRDEPLWFRLVLVALLLGTLVTVIWLLPHWVPPVWLIGKVHGAAAAVLRRLLSKCNK